MIIIIMLKFGQFTARMDSGSCNFILYDQSVNWRASQPATVEQIRQS